ncbi:MAG: flagellar basal body rod protein FlgC [Paracoccaceae bacterium]
MDAETIVALNREPEKVYEPGHPNADANGFVYKAPVNSDEEMVEMLEASRQYQNNLEVLSTVRALMMRTMNMGK